MRTGWVRILIGVTAVAFGSLPATPAFAHTEGSAEDGQAAPSGGVLESTGGDDDWHSHRDQNWHSDEDGDSDLGDWSPDGDSGGDWYWDGDDGSSRWWDRDSGHDENCWLSGDDDAAHDWGDWWDSSAHEDAEIDPTADTPAVVAAMPSTPSDKDPAGSPAAAAATPAAGEPAEPAPAPADRKPAAEPSAPELATPSYYSELSTARHSFTPTSGARPADPLGVLTLLGALCVFGAVAVGRSTRPDASTLFHRDVKRALRARRPPA